MLALNMGILAPQFVFFLAASLGQSDLSPISQAAKHLEGPELILKPWGMCKIKIKNEQVEGAPLELQVWSW